MKETEEGTVKRKIECVHRLEWMLKFLYDPKPCRESMQYLSEFQRYSNRHIKIYKIRKYH